MLISKSTKG